MSKNYGLSGLINLGNTCFMNTAIQCLSNTIPFTQYVLFDEIHNHLNERKKECHLTKEWIHLIKMLWCQNQQVKPSSFLRTSQLLAIHKGREQFRGLQQEDTTEFLNFLIDSIHESIQRKVNIVISGKPENKLDYMALDAVHSWKRYFENQYSICIELFYGQYVSKIMNCEDKNDVSCSYEPFFSTNVDIPSINHRKIDIYDCISHFCKTELLSSENQWKSEKYCKKVDAYKQIMFWKSPEIFILSFKRNMNSFLKNNTLIDFPLYNLNLKDFCVGYDRLNSIYDLYGICNHSGGSGYGHYWAYCKNPNGKWYEFNDNQVNEINETDVVTNKAYCLFYQKKKNL